MRSARFFNFASHAGVLTFLAGCGGHNEPTSPIPKPPTAPVADQVPVPKPLAASVADPIPLFVDYLGRNGIVLEEDRELSFWWKVAGGPSEEPYDVVVALKSFPPDQTPAGMETELLGVSLAFLLNAPARLAMSYPSLRGRYPGVIDEPPPDLESLPVAKELLRLFKAYPGEPGR